MKQIKRRMMNNYVEFEDGTFGKVLDPRYGATEAGDDGKWYVMVHEDEASAFEPDLYMDDVDYDDFMAEQELEEDEIINDYYDLYWKNDSNAVPGQLIKTICAEEDVIDILIRARVCNYDMFLDLLRDFKTDLFHDISTAIDHNRVWLAHRYLNVLESIETAFPM